MWIFGISLNIKYPKSPENNNSKYLSGAKLETLTKLNALSMQNRIRLLFTPKNIRRVKSIVCGIINLKFKGKNKKIVVNKEE
jgi:P pilus assembly chaperone PapD